MPARAPSARSSLARRTGARAASTWKVTDDAPASTYAGAHRSGSSIIRWQSRGRSLTLPSASTTGTPSVRLGTKWLSITSTCSQSARETRAASSASRAKSEDRMLGEIWIPMVAPILGHRPWPAAGAAGRSPATQQRQEHGIGPVAVRPQLHGAGHRAVRVGQGADERCGVLKSYVVPLGEHRGDHAGRLGEDGGAGGVQDHSAGPNAVDGGGQQRPLERDELLEVRSGPPPAGLGAAPQRSEPGAGGV